MSIFTDNLDIKWISINRKTNKILCFKKVFKIDKKITKATLYISGLGYYDSLINGARFDNHYFKPNVSDYRKRNDQLLTKPGSYFAYYDTYDVTKFLSIGNNTLDVYVAPGYFHNTDKMDAPNYDYGRTRLIYALKIEYDGTEELIFSDKSTLCAVSNSSSTLFKGDHFSFLSKSLSYSSSLELKGDINLKPSKFENDIVGKIYQPTVLLDEPKHKIFDFGYNHTGGIKCYAHAKKGSLLKVKYSEFMNQDGTLNYMSSAYSDFKEEEFTPPFYECKANKYPVIQMNTYELSGKKDLIEPLFSYRCYRYIEVECENEFKLEDLCSLFIHSNVPQVSTFESSSKNLNHIYNCYIQTQLCNLHSGLTTDCPHREKIAYTGDGQIVSRALLHNFDAVAFFDKWLDDIIASQTKEGFIPNNSPDMAGGGGHFWGYAIIQVPLELYYATNDKEYLIRAYNSMFRWIKYLSKSRDESGIITQNGLRWFLGDWLAPNPVVSDPIYINTIAFYLSIKNFLKVNDILGKGEDLQLTHLLSKTKDAINNRFFDKERCIYSKDEQGETLLGLYAGIVDPQYVEGVRESILKKYENNGYHIDTGIVCTPILFSVMSMLSKFDYAYALLMQPDYPSFYTMLKDETTFPEHWSKKWIAYKMSDDGNEILEPTGDTSHCHPMFGAIIPWIQEEVGGICLKNIRNKEIIFSPKYVKRIKSCKSSFKDIYFSYNTQDDLIEYEVNLPKDYNGILLISYGNNKGYEITNVDTNEKRVSSMPIQLNEGHYKIKSI